MHTTIKAADLRNGDVLRLGKSDNYVLVSSTEKRAGRVHVTIYNGSVPQPAPFRSYAAAEDVQVSRRNFPAS